MRNNDAIIKLIQENILDKESIEITVVELERAKHLPGKKFQYKAHLKNEPLAIFGGMYNEENQEITHPSFEYITFLSEESKKIKKMFDSEDFIVSFNFRLDTNTLSEVDFQNLSIESLASYYKKECFLIFHVYSFKDDIQISSFENFITSLSDYSEARLALSIQMYPSKVLNRSDLYSNNFRFGFNMKGYEGNFEANNLDKRIEFFEVYNVSFEELLSEWRKKTK